MAVGKDQQVNAQFLHRRHIFRSHPGINQDPLIPAFDIQTGAIRKARLVLPGQIVYVRGNFNNLINPPWKIVYSEVDTFSLKKFLDLGDGGLIVLCFAYLLFLFDGIV